MMNHNTETVRATHNSASSGAMRSQQLLERLGRLERELADAFSVQPLPEALIERLVNEVSTTELEIDAVRGDLPSRDEWLPVPIDYEIAVGASLQRFGSAPHHCRLESAPGQAVAQ